MLLKDAITAETHKTDFSHDCGVRVISVSLDAQALARRWIEINPLLKSKGVLGIKCLKFELLILNFKFQYLISLVYKIQWRCSRKKPSYTSEQFAEMNQHPIYYNVMCQIVVKSFSSWFNLDNLKFSIIWSLGNWFSLKNE